jgi:gas vesicle protein
MNEENQKKVKEESDKENKNKVAKEKKEGTNYFLGILISILTGLFVGFILGILSAPKPGKEIRKDIKDKSEEFVEKGKNKFEEVKGKGKEIIEKGKEKVEELKEVITPKKENNEA